MTAINPLFRTLAGQFRGISRARQRARSATARCHEVGGSFSWVMGRPTSREVPLAEARSAELWSLSASETRRSSGCGLSAARRGEPFAKRFPTVCDFPVCACRLSPVRRGHRRLRAMPYCGVAARHRRPTPHSSVGHAAWLVNRRVVVIVCGRLRRALEGLVRSGHARAACEHSTSWNDTDTTMSPRSFHHERTSDPHLAHRGVFTITQVS